jgi:uncharacterized protein YndB with AHSA1/START domain
MQTAEDEIRWPPEFHPSNVEVRARNEVQIQASPEQVWALLIRARHWPKWYSNSKNVRLPEKSHLDLKAGMRFRWKTFGLNLVSEVVEFVPGERLAWNARGLGTWVYHAWLLRPVDGGCWVLTEENQHGWLCRLHKFVYPQDMYRKHQMWLEGLKKKAEA